MKKCKRCNLTKFMKKKEYGIYHYAHSYCFQCQENLNEENETEVEDISDSVNQLEILFNET